MLAPFLAAFVIVIIITKYYYDNRKFYQLAAEIPHAKWDRWIDSSLPLIGYVHHFLGNSGDVYDSLKVFARKTVANGGYTKIWLGPYLYTMISDPAAAEIVLTTSLQKDKLYRLGKSWTGEGLVVADVKIWKYNRKAFHPAFSTRVVDHYVGTMNKQFRILMDRLQLLVGKGSVNVEDYLNKAAASVICNTTFNLKDCNLQTDEHSTFLETIQDHANLIFTRVFRVWLHPEFIFQLTSIGRRERRNLEILHSFSYKILGAKREEFKKRPKLNDCDEVKPMNQIPLLDLLLKMCDEEKTITTSHVRAEIDTSLEAGYASSSIAAGLLLTLLGRHPKVQEKLYNEIKDYYGNFARDVEKMDLTHLFYLDCVAKEVLRLHPLTPIVVRTTEKDLKLSEKITLPAGSGVMISVWGLHHDPNVWGEDHEEFRPERWEDKEAAAKRHICSYIPFSYGARNCIGKYQGIMQFKIMVVHLLRRFRIYADSAVPMAFKLEIFMKQRHGVLVALENR